MPSNVIKNKKIKRYLIKQQTKKFYQSHKRFYKKKEKNTMKGCKERKLAKIIWKKGYSLKKIEISIVSDKNILIVF